MKPGRETKLENKHTEAGQAMVLLILVLGLVLLGAAAFSVDIGNLWFHRQAAQNAADAVCTAAAMDMLQAGGSGTTGGKFTVGTAFTCSKNPTYAPCVYGAKNGYPATGLTAGQPGSEISVTFPTKVDGVPTCTSSTPSAICAATGLANAYVQVNVDDRAPLYFAGLLSGSPTTDVGAQARCGLVYSNAPIPLLILDPTRANTMTGNGNVNLVIVGGPQRSIQVDSSNTGAISVKGSSNLVDLSKGGPNSPPSTQGSDWGVTAQETQSTSGFNVSWGTTPGKWIDPTGVITDPFATISSPPTPAAGTTPGAGKTGVTTNGCPATWVAAGKSCTEYAAGYYPTGIQVGQGPTEIAIFDPGVYYIGGGATCTAKSPCNFFIGSNGCVRPADVTLKPGDGSGGTMFYFHGTNTIQFGANAAAKCPTDVVPPSTLQCDTKSDVPANIKTAGGVSGNVLLGPCRAPTSVTATNPSKTNYGDPLGTNDPIGEQRGIVFFQDRSADLATAKNQPSFGGGGAFGIDGTFYFHYCSSTSGDGTEAQSCSTSDYTDQLTLSGNSASNSFVIGDIVVDQLNFGGTSGVEMDLNPAALYYVLKASLLQ
jgi:putative Flp pilus-assembly TadE/G-like protein